MATSVSGDGRTVVGNAWEDEGNRGFHWTVDEGIFPLPGLGGQPMIWATAISSDGNVILGWSRESLIRSRVVRVDLRNQDIRELPTDVSGFESVEPIALSGDGEVAAASFQGEIPEYANALVWSIPDGPFEKIAIFGEPLNGWAGDLSDDGRVVVGGTMGNSAFRWSAATGVEDLGTLPGGVRGAAATGVSADGTVIVGISSALGRAEPFRWTADQGMQGLGLLPGADDWGQAVAVSGDGSVVVGVSGLSERASFIWTAGAGLRSLVDVLHYDLGLSGSLAGWSALDIADIALDASTIVGQGLNPQGHTEAWRAVLTHPSPPGDANFDGQVNLDDFGLLKANFGLGKEPEDVAYRAHGNFDGDRDVDLSDFGMLKSAMDSSPVAAVPEPSSLVLAMLAVALCGLAQAAMTWTRTRSG